MHVWGSIGRQRHSILAALRSPDCPNCCRHPHPAFTMADEAVETVQNEPQSKESAEVGKALGSLAEQVRLPAVWLVQPTLLSPPYEHCTRNARTC